MQSRMQMHISSPPKNHMRQLNQGHKIKRDNVAELIFHKDPNWLVDYAFSVPPS